MDTPRKESTPTIPKKAGASRFEDSVVGDRQLEEDDLESQDDMGIASDGAFDEEDQDHGEKHLDSGSGDALSRGGGRKGRASSKAGASTGKKAQVGKRSSKHSDGVLTKHGGRKDRVLSDAQTLQDMEGYFEEDDPEDEDYEVSGSENEDLTDNSDDSGSSSDSSESSSGYSGRTVTFATPVVTKRVQGMSAKAYKKASSAFKTLNNQADKKPFDAIKEKVHDCRLWQKWKQALQNTCLLGEVDYNKLTSKKGKSPALGTRADLLLYGFMQRLDSKNNFLDEGFSRYGSVNGRTLFNMYEEEYGAFDRHTIAGLQEKLMNMRFIGSTIDEAKHFLKDFRDLFNLSSGIPRSPETESNGIHLLLKALGSNDAWSAPTRSIIKRITKITVAQAIDIIRKDLDYGAASTIRQLSQGPSFLSSDLAGRDAVANLRSQRRAGAATFDQDSNGVTLRAGNARNNWSKKDSYRRSNNSKGSDYQERFRGPGRQVRCYRCEQVGHRVLNCPFAPPKGHQENKNKETGNFVSDTERVMSQLTDSLPNGSGTQTEAGHGQRRAGLAKMASPVEAPQSNGLDKDKEVVMATVDSGCAQTSCLTSATTLVNVKDVPRGTAGYEDLSGTTHAVTQMGDFYGKVICPNTKQALDFCLRGVYVAPTLSFGMLSAVHCQKEGASIIFPANSESMEINQGGHSLGVSKSQTNHVYEVILEASEASKRAGLARTNETSLAIVHRRLAHCNVALCKRAITVSDGIKLKPGTSADSYLETGELCGTCSTSKMTASRKSTAPAIPKTDVLRHHFSMDFIQGLTPSVKNYKYMLLVVEHVSGVIFVKACESKKLSRELLGDLATYFEVNQVPFTKTITLDRDSCFISDAFVQEAKDQGFKLIFASPGPSGHFTLGKAERGVRTVSDGGRAFLAGANLGMRGPVSVPARKWKAASISSVG
mmetsp:Transcript_8637/g.15838  ORF Transcript_8637/g.15838 Transcript_8637/m.15838 type:complete len:937 (-) Transcript_8637:395-3205(-)